MALIACSPTKQNLSLVHLYICTLLRKRQKISSEEEEEEEVEDSPVLFKMPLKQVERNGYHSLIYL